MRDAAKAGRRDKVWAILGEKGGASFAADVLASLSADVERVKERPCQS